MSIIRPSSVHYALRFHDYFERTLYLKILARV